MASSFPEKPGFAKMAVRDRIVHFSISADPRRVVSSPSAAASSRDRRLPAPRPGE
jgi:hypothetical protein